MKEYVKALLLAHFLLYVTVGFEIPILRQIVSFLYLTFVPGFVILKALKLESKTIDKILLSAGLSIAFLMFYGLIVSELFSIFGILKPFSIIPLTVTISGFTLSLLFVGCRQDFVTKTAPNHKWLDFRLESVLLIIFPILGIIGALWGNISILLVMIVGIAILYGLGALSMNDPKLYAFVIFSISLALLFHTSLTSKYLMGWDIHHENYVSSMTELRGYWRPPAVGVYSETARIESVVSTTILPTIYSVFLDTQAETIFKVVYPLIFALVPLVLYRVYESQTSKAFALISVFFFISSPYSFFGAEPLSLARQIIGELFFVLSIFLIMDKQMPIQKKRILFLVFGAALVVSHYALSYFYLFLIVLTFVLMRRWRMRTISTQLITVFSVLLLFAITFSWYLYVSEAPLVKITEDARRIYNNFISDLFNPRARSSQVATLASPPPNIVSIAHRVIFYIENFFIAIGVLWLFLKGDKTGIDAKYRIMSIVSMIIMILCLGVPYFAASFQLTRFYAITMPFLALFFVLGGQMLLGWIKKELMPFSNTAGRFSRLLISGSHKITILQLICVVLVLSFLFSTGFVDHIAGTYPESLALDKDRRKMSNDEGIRISSYKIYMPDQDVFSATWLSNYMNKTSSVCADEDSRYYVLLSYALISSNQSRSLLLYPLVGQPCYAYLSSMNLAERKIADPSLLNLSVIYPALSFSNKIYSNGASEVYQSPG